MGAWKGGVAGVVLLLGMAGGAQAAPCAGFTDVDDTSGFCTSVAWMKNRAITLGCTATEYCPADYVRRDQMAAFLYRLGVQNAFLNGGNGFGATAVLGTTDNHSLDVRIAGASVMRYQTAGVPNLIGGHFENTVNLGQWGQVIGGGGSQGINCPDPVTGAFRPCRNETNGMFASILGGSANGALANGATVGGGWYNVAGNAFDTVGGGRENYAGGGSATVPGGFRNTATGSWSFAAGTRAKATHNNSFVWGGDSSVDTVSDAQGVFLVNAPGGIKLFPASGGCTLTSGGSGWSCASDRALKSDIALVDSTAMLERVVSLPVSRWSFASVPGVMHVGPMAQDFHAAFGLGDDDRMLAPMDVQGVALAAIQGLNTKVEEQARQLEARDAEIALLRSGLADLRRAVEALSARGAGDERVAAK